MIIYRFQSDVKTLLIILQIFTFSLFILHFTGCTKPGNQAMEHYNKGINLLEREDYTSAIIEFRNALQINPSMPEAHYKLGLAYIETGDAVNAFRELEMTSQLDPTNLDALIKSAEMLYQGNEFNESRKRLKKVLAQDANYIDALILAANLDLHDNHINDAESYIDKAIKLNPNLDRIYLTRANIYLAKKNYDLVRKSIEKAIAINPKNEAAYRALIIYWLKREDTVEAEKVLHKMIEIFPDSPFPFLEMARIQEETKDVSGSEQSILKAIEKLPGNPELQIVLGKFYEKYGKNIEAENAYKKAITLAKKPLSYRAALADFYFRQDRLELARDQLNTVLTKQPNNPEANFIRAKILLKENKIPEALELLEEISLKKPEWHEVLYYKAQAQAILDERSQAIKNMQNAVKLSPGNPVYHLFLGQLLYDRADFQPALQEADTVLKLKSDSFPAGLLYGKSLYMLQSYDKAVRFFEKIKGIVPDNFEVLQYLGLSYLASHDYRKAQQNLQNAIGIKSGYSKALEGSVHILLLQKKTTTAIQLVAKQLAQYPSSPNLLLLYGSLLYKSKKYEEALATFQHLQELAPKIPATYMMEAVTLKALGRFKKETALKYRDIAHNETATPSSQMVLAVLLEMAGDIAGAKDAYRRVLELDPKFSGAANNLAWLLANDGNSDNLGEALNLAQTAKELEPGEPVFADTLGWVYYKQGRHYIAAVEFNQAIEKSPTTPVYYYHLALALAGQDKREEAVKAVQRSLESAGSFDEQDEAAALYKKLTGTNFK